MKSRTWMWTAAVYLLASLAVTIGLAAQDNPSQNSVAMMDNDHDRGPRNGELAVSAVTVVGGSYGTNQIATLPSDGGRITFLQPWVKYPMERSTLISLPTAIKYSSGRSERRTLFTPYPPAGVPLLRFKLIALTILTVLGTITRRFRQMAERCSHCGELDRLTRMVAPHSLASTSFVSMGPTPDRFQDPALPVRVTGSHAGRLRATKLFFSTMIRPDFCQSGSWIATVLIVARLLRLE
jgi:hypothetical protein